MASQESRDISTQRMQSAAVRACSSLASCRLTAERVREELDEVTAPHTIQTGYFDEEDSVVAILDEVFKRKG